MAVDEQREIVRFYAGEIHDMAIRTARFATQMEKLGQIDEAAILRVVTYELDELAKKLGGYGA